MDAENTLKVTILPSGNMHAMIVVYKRKNKANYKLNYYAAICMHNFYYA